MKSRGPVLVVLRLTPAGSFPSVRAYPAGGFRMAILVPALIPSFWTSGFPEYPAILYRPLYITRQIVPPASSVTYSDPSGPTATPTGRCFGPDGSSFQKPSAKVSYVPTGLPSLNGTNTTR